MASESSDHGSMLSLFRALAGPPSARDALAVGSCRLIGETSDAILAYERGAGADRIVVVLNFTAVPATVDLTAVAPAEEVVLSTALDRGGREALDALALRPDEGIIVDVG